MAKSTRNKEKNKDTQAPEPKSTFSAKQLRLTVGIVLFLIGIFTSISVLSYFFTWKLDQDLLLSGSSWSHFLFSSDITVANWVGRFGAVSSHMLVFEGVGIAAIAIGLWIIGFSLNLINGRKVVPAARYLRWLCMLLIVLPPLLTFVLPANAFPFGGAWGNESVAYMNGIFGLTGTGLVMLAVVCFFLFVVLALDIRPLLRGAKKTAKKVADVASTNIPKISLKSDGEDQPNKEDVVETEEKLKPLSAINDKATQEEDFGLTLTESEIAKEEPKQQKKVEVLHQISFDNEEDNDDDEEHLQANNDVLLPIEETLAPTPKKKEEKKEDIELSFEVTKKEEEKAAPEHGGHISIEDNEPYAPELDLPDYKFPTLDLLEERETEDIILNKEELEKNKNQIIQTLRSFGIEIQRISATVGPTVTLYEIVPAEGVRISKIRNLEDDIALNLAALGIRIIAPIPGRGTIGIEVPNANKQIVSIRALLSSDKFSNTKMSLPIALGKKIDNEHYIVDLATMPHLLMAGATGQGKSVGINTILVSLLYKKHPSQLKFVMVDPKKVELSVYRTIENHFLAKLPNEEEAIITDTKKVINTLNALCIEMDNRYELLKEAGSRNIKEYNAKFIKRRLNPENGHKYLPFIVLVIDEFADLIMTAGKEVEMPIARLAQLARAVGIHLIIATQRPSVNVITGTIKANFPARIAFKVSAKVDSRTILDAGGAEQLIGRGDMLISFGSELLRLQCAFVDTPEVENVTEYIGDQRGYPGAFELPEYESEEESGSKNVDLTNRDKLFEECARTVVSTQSGSTSMLQRRFNLGYNRAGRIMDQLEAAGVVGPSAGSKPREVLVHTEAELEQFLTDLI